MILLVVFSARFLVLTLLYSTRSLSMKLESPIQIRHQHRNQPALQHRARQDKRRGSRHSQIDKPLLPRCQGGSCRMLRLNQRSLALWDQQMQSCHHNSMPLSGTSPARSRAGRILPLHHSHFLVLNSITLIAHMLIICK